MSRHPLDRLRCDPDNWKLGIFYFCRADQRMIVPKRICGLGWTLNFARPLAVPFLVFAFALVYGVVELAGSFEAGGDAHFAVKLLSALGLIALCYRISNSPVKKTDTEVDSENRKV
jgi:hypothetical protein